LHDLAAIGAADEADVRAVVDAYRAPRCNFLTPELHPSHPRPLDAAAVVDISHESLIRQWQKLSEWLEKEARSVRQWRRLRDRFEDGQPMQGTELANMVAWRQAEKPNVAWARRYGGDFPAIIRFIETSERMRRRFAPAVMALFAFTALVVGILIHGGSLSYIYGAESPSWRWVSELARYAEVTAITCAFGLWRYAGTVLPRAMAAGATIFLLNFALGTPSIAVAMSNGATSIVAMRWWEVLASTPLTLIGLAIFDREFRNVFVWFPLIAIISPPLCFIFLSSAVPDNARIWFAYLISILWYVGLGYQLRRGDGSIEDGARSGRTSASWALPILGLSTFATLCLWAIGAWGLLFGPTPPSRTWPISAGIVAATTAITCAAGVWRYRNFGLARATRVGLSIFVVDFASAAALIEVLLAHDFPEKLAGAWWGACLYAPCTLLVLAAFDPALRRLPTLVVLAAVFCGPYGLMAWLNGSATLAMSDATLTLLFVIIFSLWLAAIGRTLQHPMVESAKLQGAAKDDAAASVPVTPERTPAVA
jgi:hypothetical protein